jgi:glycerol uptake operon antiterminator
MFDIWTSPIIAAVRAEDDLDFALEAPVEVVFLLNSSILSLHNTAARTHSAGKKLFVHMDFAEGVGRDKAGLQFVGSCGVDGVLSTRSGLVRLAHECGLITVQRFFIVDSHSVDTAVDSIRATNPDMIELMPGIVLRAISSFKAKVSMPIIAGGLIETKSDIIEALSAGASAISTGKKELWYE